MGKDFRREINNLKNSYEYAINQDVNLIEEFLSSSIDSKILFVGSGGSYSVACACSYFSQISDLSAISKAITPFELDLHHHYLRDMCVALLSAGGNNPDSVNAYKYISQYRPYSFITICTRKNSKISRIKKTSDMLFDVDLPTGKDGFLAVNSIIASIAMIGKAYNNLTSNMFFQLNTTLNSKLIQKKDLEGVLSKRTIIVLHGGMSTPVAIDFESKFTEGALANIQLADYRNFAHGRHHWIAKNINDTSVIAFISPREKKIAYKTLSLIPKNIPYYLVETGDGSINGMIHLWDALFKITLIAGDFNNLNPGMPHIPEYGKKIYRISFNPSTMKEYKKNLNIVDRSLYRKNIKSTSELRIKYIESFRTFLTNLEDTRFDGIIFDYDGTIHSFMDNEIENEIYCKINEFLSNGIFIGVATGRGKSIRVEMQRKIQRKYWNLVTIAYYNGGEIGLLSDDETPNINIECNTDLKEIYDLIMNDFSSQIEINIRPKQITVMQKKRQDYKQIKEVIKLFCNDYTQIKIMESGHSLDIVPKSSSKLEIANNLKEKKLLMIGDSGQQAGNDFEMLSTTYGISVKNVSASMYTCWNFAPFGFDELESTLYYLSLLKIGNGYFNFKKII